MPVLVLLFFGMAFAGWYAFRSTSADWGVFISGVARGSFNTPASTDGSILWSDIRSSIGVHAQPAKRQVSSILGMSKSQDWLYGITLNETHTGRTYFRLWRFYPGPPPPGGWE
jgi:hypothetical protein